VWTQFARCLGNKRLEWEKAKSSRKIFFLFFALAVAVVVAVAAESRVVFLDPVVRSGVSGRNRQYAAWGPAPRWGVPAMVVGVTRLVKDRREVGGGFGDEREEVE